MNASPTLTLELARLAEIESCHTKDREQADYLGESATRLRDTVNDRAITLLVPHLEAGKLVRVTIGSYSDTVGRHAEATATTQRYSTVTYWPGSPSGDEDVHDTAAEAAAAFVGKVGAMAVFAELEPADELHEDHSGEARRERDQEWRERGW